MFSSVFMKRILYKYVSYVFKQFLFSVLYTGGTIGMVRNNDGVLVPQVIVRTIKFHFRSYEIFRILFLILDISNKCSLHCEPENWEYKDAF